MKIASPSRCPNPFWALAYDTGHGDEIEFIGHTFFDSAEEAEEYFLDIYGTDCAESTDFINPRPVRVSAEFSLAPENKYIRVMDSIEQKIISKI